MSQLSEQVRPHRGDAPHPGGRGARIGQRAAIAFYYAVVGAIAVVSTYQVGRQVFAPAAAAPPLPFSSCATGVRALHEAVEAGRRAAELAAEDEDAALARYRAALDPAWRHRDAVARLCVGNVDPDGRLKATLDAVERLRYSEEHGVRHQAAELSALRRRVRTLIEETRESE